MSFDAQSWARKIVTGNGVRKAVLMAIANRANDADGACWPSQSRIATETEFSVRAVRNALTWLEDNKIISRIKRKDTTDMIYLHMDDPGDGSTIKPQAPRAGSGGGKNGPSSTHRHQIPQGEARDSADERHDMPQGAAGDAGDPRHQVPTNLSDEPSLNPSDEPTENRNASFPADAFEQFWKLYPDKKGKQYVREIWERKIECGKADFESIMAGLRTYIRCKPKDRPWLNPSTFLNQARWEDEWNESSRQTDLNASRRMAI
jgi:hypothetical protein